MPHPSFSSKAPGPLLLRPRPTESGSMAHLHSSQAATPLSAKYNATESVGLVFKTRLDRMSTRAREISINLTLTNILRIDKRVLRYNVPCEVKEIMRVENISRKGRL
jgi:hypothetical protein